MNAEINPVMVEITVGVSGHRWITETTELLSAIDKVFEKINQVYSFSNLKVISPLAEGADRIIARRSISFVHAYLIALLPFPEKEYLKDFSTQESVQEFQGLIHQAKQIIELMGCSIREEAYIALGKTLLDRCEILITIWDGKPANGRGGTAEIVYEARRRGLPIAWIHVEEPRLVDKDLSVSKEDQIKVVFERFPSARSIADPEN
jgi:hypothetical protein